MFRYLTVSSSCLSFFYLNCCINCSSGEILAMLKLIADFDLLNMSNEVFLYF